MDSSYPLWLDIHNHILCRLLHYQLSIENLYQYNVLVFVCIYHLLGGNIHLHIEYIKCLIDITNIQIDINNMILNLNNIHQHILCIECNHHHSSHNLTYYIKRMLMKINHMKWHIANNFGHRFDIVCNVNFDKLHISCLHIDILADIKDIGMKCCMFDNLIDHISHIDFLQVYNNHMNFRNNMKNSLLLY